MAPRRAVPIERVGNMNPLRSGIPVWNFHPRVGRARGPHSGQDPTSPPDARQSPNRKTPTAHAPSTHPDPRGRRFYSLATGEFGAGVDRFRMWAVKNSLKRHSARSEGEKSAGVAAWRAGEDLVSRRMNAGVRTRKKARFGPDA